MTKKLFYFLLFIYSISYSQIPPPDSGCYHAAFTGNDSQQQFETLAKKDIAIEMFFTGWPSNRIPDFPLSKCDQIVANGAMPQVSDSRYPFPLDAIINGPFDNYIKSYAEQVKNWGKQLFIRLGHEFNGDWYTYGGANNGGGTTDGFGDPAVADGPERFIAAYKHVHDLFNEAGVTNVTWIWCPNNGSSPSASWNKPENYYPGDDYVDWIGFDGYNFGTTQTWSGWTDFWSIYRPLYATFENYDKPFMIGEFASVESGGNKASWITDAYTKFLKYSFPKIKAVTWFHVRKFEGTVDTDWRINSSDQALTSYQNVIADPYYVSQIVTGVKEESKNELPESFELKQNYPNPFNPATTIKFTIPYVETQHAASLQYVTLRIYDILGREIATLVNESKSPGNYKIEFNGYQIPSGMYFYTLTSGNYSKTMKMVLIK